MKTLITLAITASALLLAGPWPGAFKVLAFYPHTDDLAHVSFIGEANKWFPELARTRGFSYEATDDWQVAQQYPLPGDQVPPGTYVYLFVKSPADTCP